MPIIYEHEVSLPYFSYTKSEMYHTFDEYFNAIYGEDSELINVQLLSHDENERNYIFWYK